jgi:threonine/homoserine efflux transporter RhtA
MDTGNGHGGSGMNHTLRVLIAAMVVLLVAGPALVQVLEALVPLVLVGGVVAAGLRLLWFYTSRW